MAGLNFVYCLILFVIFVVETLHILHIQDSKLNNNFSFKYRFFSSGIIHRSTRGLETTTFGSSKVVAVRKLSHKKDGKKKSFSFEWAKEKDFFLTKIQTPFT